MQIGQQKALVLFSGGLDSTVVLSEAIKSFGVENVRALTVFYGQKHQKELDSAYAVVRHYGVSHRVVNLEDIFGFSDSSLLGESGKELPKGDYAKQQKEAGGILDTYVPYRNGVLLSYAASMAVAEGFSTVAYGAHADDAAGSAYPDCSPEFYRAQEAAIFHGTGGRVQLVAPLQSYTKPLIVALGKVNGAPLELTWSCYEGGELHCGECATCIDRREAFRILGGEDPVKYASGAGAEQRKGE